MPTPPLAPDPMPLREALRGLRHLLRRGGLSLRDTMATEALPKPAGKIATVVMREMEAFAASVDQVASGLARSVLGGSAPETTTLQGASDPPFAAALYAALRAVLRHLGAPGVFVSEAAARQALPGSQGPGMSEPRRAAHLTLDLLAAKVIRDPTADEAALVPGGALQPVALFAVMLWLQSSRADDENEAAMTAATDIALTLAADVAQACADRNLDRLDALYAKYAAHV